LAILADKIVASDAPAKKKELLDLVAADVAQNTAVFDSFEKPRRPRTSGQTMRSEAQHVNYPSDRSVLHKLPRKYGAFDVEPLAIVDHVFPTGLDRSGPRLSQLSQLSKRSFVSEIVFAGSHDLDAERRSFRRDRGSGDQMHVGVVQNLRQ
jgi:hypothetical protein